MVGVIALVVVLSLAEVPVTLGDRGEIFLGSPPRPVSQAELFETVGRPDLAEEARAVVGRRTALIVTGAALGVASVATGLGLMLTSNPFSDGDCGPRPANTYCVVSAPCAKCEAGPIILGAGLVSAGVLLIIGLRLREDLLTPPELRRFLFGLPGVRASQLQLTPWLGPTAGGVMARLAF